MKNKLAALSVILALACLAAPAAWAQSDTHTMVKPGDLKWTDVPALPAGAKLAVMEGPLDQAVPITFRLKFPANYQIPAHSHPTVEHVTVISGNLNLGTGDKLDRAKTKAMPAGSFGIMPAKMNHFAWTKGETIVQIHGTEPWASTTSIRRTTREKK